MTMYAQTSLATNLSVLVSSIETQHEAIRGMERGTVAPTIKPTGMIWCRTDYPTIGESIVRWDGSAWNLLLDPDHAQLNAGGTVVPTADLPMNSKKLTGLAAGSANGHSVRYEQVMLLSGANAMTGDLDLGGNTIVNVGDDIDMDGNTLTNLGAPSADDDAARKIDVDNAGPTRGVINNPHITAGTHTETLGYEPKWIIFWLRFRGTPPGYTAGILFTDEIAVNTAETTVVHIHDSTGAVQTFNLTVTRKSTGFELTTNLSNIADNRLFWMAYR